MDKVNLQEAVRNTHPMKIRELLHRADKIKSASTKDELREFLSGRFFKNSIDWDSFERVDDLNALKHRLLVNYIGYKIHLLYADHRSIKGPKSDRMRRFFESLTNDPQDVYDLADRFQLAYSVIKQHRRYDPYPERGQTIIKKGHISRKEND